MDFQNNIQVIEAAIGYTFRDKSLLRQAFTRASYCNEGHGDHQSNEVLEFFGDSALSLAIVTNFIEKKTERYRYGIRTDLTEGDLSNMRSRLTDKKNLSDVIKKLDLEKYLIVGNGDAKLDVKSEKSVREDLCEAIIGAVYIDSGFSVPVIIAVTERMMDISHYLAVPTAAQKSPKNILQEWCADKKRRLSPPTYEKVAESGPDHDKRYTAVCMVGGKEVGRAEARRLKDAEAEAAAMALVTLGIKDE